MRNVRIGIFAQGAEVRVVLVRGARLMGAASAAIGGEEELGSALEELFRGFGLPRFPQPRAILVLGPARSQVRSLSGLPSSGNPRVLREVIAQDASRFFAWGGVPMLLTGVRPEGDGAVWASALSATDVREVEGACRAHGIRLEAAVALPVALAQVLGDGGYEYRDGSVATEFQVSGSTLVAVRRAPAPPSPAAPLPLLPALEPLGEEGAAYLGAYAGTLLRRHEPLALRLSPGEPPRWRLAAAAAAFAVAVVLSAWLPAARTADATRAAKAELTRTRAVRQAAAREARELAQVTAALRQAGEFADRRRSAVSLLAGLAGALPDGSALASVKVDSTGGTIVVLAPRAAEALAQVGRVRGLRSPAITGGVTRETIEGRAVERVAIRFAWDDAARRAAGSTPP